MSFPIFDAVQRRSTTRTEDRYIRLWVADEALCGLVYRPQDDSGSGQSASATIGSGVVTAPLDILLYGWFAFVFWLAVFPATLVMEALEKRRKKESENRLDAFAFGVLGAKLSNGEYLNWNRDNFRLAIADIESAHFLRRSRFVRPFAPVAAERLQLRLSRGQEWNFTLGSRADAEQLCRILAERGTRTRWDDETAS